MSIFQDSVNQGDQIWGRVQDWSRDIAKNRNANAKYKMDVKNLIEKENRRKQMQELIAAKNEPGVDPARKQEILRELAGLNELNGVYDTTDYAAQLQKAEEEAEAERALADNALFDEVQAGVDFENEKEQIALDRNKEVQEAMDYYNAITTQEEAPQEQDEQEEATQEQEEEIAQEYAQAAEIAKQEEAENLTPSNYNGERYAKQQEQQILADEERRERQAQEYLNHMEEDEELKKWKAMEYEELDKELQLRFDNWDKSYQNPETRDTEEENILFDKYLKLKNYFKDL